MIRTRTVARSLASVAFAALLVACGTAPQTTGPTPVASKEAAATPAPVSSADLAHAVVQIVAYLQGEEGSAWWGSGTVISPDGLILTNAHVAVADETEGTLDRLEVAVTTASDTPPEPTYVAEVVASDWALDLAVLRISERIGGGALPTDLKYAALGDSDALEIGDPIRILGYPGIGGETITLTSGLVSGFVSEAGLGNRAWVKTDATIAGGNSGGMAVNARGELIGVPTIAAAGSDVDDIVDCRAVRDTNRDGRINDDDDCVPIGGFLNGLRPIALAADMIGAAERGVAYQPIAPPPASVAPDALADVFWDSPTFGSGVTDDDAPIGEAIGFAVGTTSICAFWTYEGMAPGMRWSAEWSVDGVQDPDVSFLDETWTLDPAGQFWVCADDEDGFAAGVYDVAMLVEDEFMVGGFVIVGDDLATSTVTIRNDSSDTLCYVYASPKVATVWGPERIGGLDVVDPGGDVTFDLIGADYDLLGQDCDGNDLFTEPLDVSGLSSAGLSWTGSSLVRTDASGGSDLGLGDCFNGPVGVDRGSTDIVSCDAPHDYEIVGLLAYAATDAFPGADALTQRKNADCPAAFESYVGIAYDDSVFYITAWQPSEETWAAGDRLIVCALNDADGDPLTGSMKGAAR